MNQLEDDGLKIVCANVRPDEGLGLQEKVVPSLRTEAGPVTIGVTAVLDLDALEKLNDPDKGFMLSSKAPNEVLPDVLKDLESDTQVQILMVQGSPESARRLAQAYPGFDVVVATSEFVDPPKDAETLNDGKTMLITVGKKGQYAGVLGLFNDPDPRFRYHRIELNQNFNNKTEPIRTMIDTDFQDELRRAAFWKTTSSGRTSSAPARATPPTSAPRRARSATRTPTPSGPTPSTRRPMRP